MKIHSIIETLQTEFNQSDETILLLLAQGTLVMMDIQKRMMQMHPDWMIEGFDDNLLYSLEQIDEYLSNILEGDLT